MSNTRNSLSSYHGFRLHKNVGFPKAVPCAYPYGLRTPILTVRLNNAFKQTKAGLHIMIIEIINDLDV